jgi:hypothetical protein
LGTGHDRGVIKDFTYLKAAMQDKASSSLVVQVRELK